MKTMKSNNRSSRVRYIIIGSLLYSALSCTTPGLAQQTGRLRLPDLPPQTHVYVDTKPVAVQNGSLSLKPGWHRVQVETMSKNGLMAYRRWVRVDAGQTTEMTLVWHRVLTSGPLYATPGMPGPAGEPGPNGHAYRPLPAQVDISALQTPMREVRDILLNDLAARLQDAINTTYTPESPVYLVNVQASPPGSSGALGPQGSPGLPAEAALIQNDKGIAMDNLLARRLGLEQIEASLAALRQRTEAIPKAEQNLRPAKIEAFQILTPAWKAKSPPPKPEPIPEGMIREIPDVVGPRGAPGVRGKNGVPTAQTPALRLTPGQQKQLLDALISEKETHEKLQQIKQLLRELEQKVYNAEGLHLERFPPSLSEP